MGSEMGNVSLSLNEMLIGELRAQVEARVAGLIAEELSRRMEAFLGVIDGECEGV
jgi:hypothetical protein